MESCDQYEEEDWWKDSHGTNNSEIRKLGVVIKATCDKACGVIFVDYIAIFSTNIVKYKYWRNITRHSTNLVP